MLYTKGFIKAALALTAIASASSAMAVNATAILNTALLTANSITVTKVGGATYNSTSGALALAEQAASSTLPIMADFAAADGFKANGGSGIFGYSLTFSDFQFTNTGVLKGTLIGGGLLSSLNYTGEQLVASTLTNTADGLLATNFSATSGLSAYLSDNGASASLINTIGTMVTSMTTPGLAVTAVPEPSTYALMGLGLVGISLVARRRRQAA